jgi:hypothetical protein
VQSVIEMGAIQPTTMRKSPSFAQAFCTHYYAGVIRVLSCTKIIHRSIHIVNSSLLRRRDAPSLQLRINVGSRRPSLPICRAAGRTR